MRRVFLLGLLVAMPLVASAAANNFSDLAATIISLVNYASGVVIAAAIAVYFWAIAKDFKALMSGETKNQITLLVWGMIGIFVMVSIWGILRVISNSIFNL